MKYSAQQIANWFLAYNDYMMAANDADGITHLKLQKLLYYAQGAFLAFQDGEPLFNEKILAWMHGPVVREVYEKYHGSGSESLKPDEDFDMHQIDKDDAETLRAVYDTFGQYSAWKLRDMTHEEAPWKETLQGCEIDREKIRKYFLENYVEN